MVAPAPVTGVSASTHYRRTLMFGALPADRGTRESEGQAALVCALDPGRRRLLWPVDTVYLRVGVSRIRMTCMLWRSRS